MSRTKEAFEHTKGIESQKVVEIRRGLTLRRTAGGIPVMRLHYYAHPERDSDAKGLKVR